jgi:hypothetical protein
VSKADIFCVAALTPSSARQNQQESPLLKLPPEIRNQIFQLAIGDKKYHTLSEPSRSFLRRWEDKHAVALLRCCRQIYAETALLPWSQYTFKFSTSQQMRIWFRQQRAVYCNVMTKVEFNFAMRSIGRGPNMGPGRCRLGTGSEPASWILPNLPALQSIRVSVKASDFCFCFQDTKVATEAMQDAQKSLQDELRVLHPNIVILGSTYSEDS